MNVGGLDTQFVLLLVAGVLLLIFVCVQTYRIHVLERDIDRVTLRYQQHIAASSPRQIDVFSASPFPCFIIDRHGIITSANTPFLKLISPNKVKSVQEFDKITLASLTKAVTPQDVHHEMITMRDPETDKLRQFTVISWPLRAPHVSVGRVVTLHEQTNVLRRKAHQADFERQLIQCMASLSNELQDSLKHRMFDTTKLSALNQELTDLSQYLLDLHMPLREVKRLSTADVVQVIKSAVDEVRPIGKSRQHAFVLTLPRASGVHIEEQSFKLALTTALTALIEYGKKDTIRIHTENTAKHLLLTINAEELVFSEREIENMFAFGEQHSSDSRIRTLHLRAAVVRELCSKHGVQFLIDSHADLGTSMTFSILRTKD